MLARVDEIAGPGEPEPGGDPAQGRSEPQALVIWSLAAALVCAAAGLVALNFEWRPTPWLRALDTWEATLLEGGLLGLASGFSFRWWEAVQRGRIDVLSGALLLSALVTLYLLLASFLLEQALGTSDSLTLPQRAATSLQLAAVLLAALIAYVKARVLPLRPLLSLAGGVFVSSCLAQLLASQVGGGHAGGGLSASTGLPYAFALPLGWTLAELFGRSPLTTAAD